MPKKIKELKRMLRKAGFLEISGKGSHTNWTHPLYLGKVTISGKDGSDAKAYQEKETKQAIEEVNRKKQENIDG